MCRGRSSIPFGLCICFMSLPFATRLPHSTCLQGVYIVLMSSPGCELYGVVNVAPMLSHVFDFTSTALTHFLHNLR